MYSAGYEPVCVIGKGHARGRSRRCYGLVASGQLRDGARTTQAGTGKLTPSIELDSASRKKFPANMRVFTQRAHAGSGMRTANAWDETRTASVAERGWPGPGARSGQPKATVLQLCSLASGAEGALRR